LKQFVLDCSFTMSWFFSDEADEHSIHVMTQLLAGKAFVPTIWAFEVVNVLLVNEKRKRLKSSEPDWILEKLGQMPIFVDDFKVDKHKLLALAKNQGLSSYDAAYLDLAVRLRLPLATRDKILKKAAESIGMEII
jgi:predicted nucleic acid-binding protein